MKWVYYKTLLRDALIRSAILIGVILTTFVLLKTFMGALLIFAIYGLFVVDFVLTIKELVSRKFKMFALVPQTSNHFYLPQLIRYSVTTFIAGFLSAVLLSQAVTEALSYSSQSISIAINYMDIATISFMLVISLINAIAYYAMIVLLIQSNLLPMVKNMFVRILGVIVFMIVLGQLQNYIFNNLLGGSDMLASILNSIMRSDFNLSSMYGLTALTLVTATIYYIVIFFIREKALDY